MPQLTIALTKGRILKETLPLFSVAGIEPVEDISKSRKLTFETTSPDVRFLILRGSDVPTYVEFGAADVGVSGKDTLMEHGSASFYEPLDLKISKCRLMTAGIANHELPQGRIKVATKYVNLAKRYYAEKGLQADIIKLYGAMELAPLMNLADEIVDIVDTGNTLKANGLVPRDTIAEISSRLIVNKASMKMKHQQIEALIEAIGSAVNDVEIESV